MKPILAGIETEYGLLIDGRSAEDQVDDSMALVRAYPGECFVGWDYRFESPRADLRGFQLDHLAYDPEDAKFDAGKVHAPSHVIRADRILPNGARFYNDHGHPEYSTPECLSLTELAAHDHAGQSVVLEAARAYAEETGRSVTVYKNNSDFHGASYGTHEGYLAPRSLGFQKLFAAIAPMLIARQILVGSGKVGAENGHKARFQLTQRADFFMEPVNAETLYRRPIFNTRDEPHADPTDWIRVHVIAGDANMIPVASARKVGLVKLALALAAIDQTPVWKIKEPVQAFQSISKDESYRFPIELDGRSWTTAYDVLESYFATAEAVLDLDADFRWLVDSSRLLMRDLSERPDVFRRQVDWAAKRHILLQALEENGGNWNDPTLRSYDLEYHNIDPDEGLYSALAEMGELDESIDVTSGNRLTETTEGTRAFARGVAVSHFKDHLVSASWRSLVFRLDGRTLEVELFPDREYPAHLRDVDDVGTFIEMLKGVK